MQHTDTLVIRLAFTTLFLATLAVGGVLFRNFEKFFGAHPDLPSENASARTYTKVQVFALWAHAVFLTGAFALLLH